MIMSRDENIVRNGNIKIGNLSFEDVMKFKYLGATVTNINDTREEIKHRINMGNVCYYSVEKLLSSSLLSKNLKVRIYETGILSVVLYGCETWTLTLREEHRLRVFENKVLRKIFGAKRDEVTGEWRKLHNTELHALYSSPDIIRNIKSRRLRWGRHVARMDESRNAYRVLVGRPEGKRPLGRPKRRWEDNIKMDLREVGYDDRDLINLAQDRDQWRAYVRAVMNLRVICAFLSVRFTFLECDISYHGEIDINGKIATCNKMNGTIRRTLKRKVRKETIMKFNKVIAMPTCLYGSETWTMTKRDISRLQATKMRFIRARAGYSLTDRKRNTDIRKDRNAENLIKKVEEYRSSWSQHVQRMNNDRIPEQIMEYKPKGRRS
ncbi:hypothetical protein ANN_03345 [Periplaneta americana]|uniref:Endonuclease-reverse transcriptase n=1 Tax=Periplaneta americana TaxID=6978 RepID=A0ABQ8U0I9_PERAM|nr:hypothetical protein ANN_03345 [Periplaneta americana]